MNEHTYCEETIQIWLDDLSERGTDLSEEIADIIGAIKNEKLWLEGSSDSGKEFHEQNIADLMEYLMRLMLMKGEENA